MKKLDYAVGLKGRRRNNRQPLKAGDKVRFDHVHGNRGVVVAQANDIVMVKWPDGRAIKGGPIVKTGVLRTQVIKITRNDDVQAKQEPEFCMHAQGITENDACEECDKEQESKPVDAGLNTDGLIA